MFTGKYILSPMVRVGGLPFRLTCLHYGADLVYAEEVIAHRLLKSTKVINETLGTVDFLDEDGGVCFRTTSEESDKVFFQMGVSDPEVAAQAALMIEPHVAGIDVNMGCPKDYSIKGNMGAALLSQPDLIKKILCKLVSVCSKPVTCKIRILKTEEATVALCKEIASTGIAALTVHGRTRYTRSSHACNYDIIKAIKAQITIPVILNGASLDITNKGDMTGLMKETGADSIMVARAAWYNPSIFRDPEPAPVREAVQTFMRYCIDYNCSLHILKYTMGKFRGAFKDGATSLEVTRHIEAKLIYQYFGLGDYYDEVKSRRSDNIQEEFQRNKRQKLGQDYKILEEELTPPILQSFRSKIAPKQILNQWLEINGFTKPTFWTTDSNRIFTGFLKIDNDTFAMEGNFKNKKTAIQAVSYAYCMKQNIELRHYKTGSRTKCGDCKCKSEG
ncbi:tRNA-dihydrouridine(20) synthase [NAD(P)+]-like [Bolinopsis microptera]|uniref:tRNA-dihydrouridine(20) synthase [NAD(P)+]-like n=1 Tax=Bolinopsis microptera TaxID=2820187 RepID=UPI003079E866